MKNVNTLSEKQKGIINYIQGQFDWHDKEGARLNKRHKKAELIMGILIAITPIITLITVLPESVRLLFAAITTSLVGIIKIYITIYDISNLAAEYRLYAEDLRTLIALEMPEDEASYKQFYNKFRDAERRHRKVYAEIRSELKEELNND